MEQLQEVYDNISALFREIYDTYKNNKMYSSSSSSSSSSNSSRSFYEYQLDNLENYLRTIDEDTLIRIWKYFDPCDSVTLEMARIDNITNFEGICYRNGEEYISNTITSLIFDLGCEDSKIIDIIEKYKYKINRLPKYYISIYSKNIKYLRRLLQSCNDFDNDGNWDYVLYDIIQNCDGCVDIIDFLNEIGKLEFNHGIDIMSIVCKNEWIDIFDRLIHYGYEINNPNNNDNDECFRIICSKKNVDFFNRMMVHGYDIHRIGSTCLYDLIVNHFSLTSSVGKTVYSDNHGYYDFSFMELLVSFGIRMDDNQVLGIFAMYLKCDKYYRKDPFRNFITKIYNVEPNIITRDIDFHTRVKSHIHGYKKIYDGLVMKRHFDDDDSDDDDNQDDEKKFWDDYIKSNSSN